MAVVRGFQAIGLIVLYVVICSTPLFIGKPTIRTSYLDLLNATIQRGSDPCENAQVYYDKAASLLPEDTYHLTALSKRWPGDFNDTERVSLIKWLADSKPAIELLRQAAQKPLCWSIYDANLSEAAKQKREEQNKRVKMVVVTKKSFTHRLLEIGGYYDPSKEAIILNETESLSKISQLTFRMQYQILYEAYKKEKGEYPETLEQLVDAGYLKELPMDPYSDTSLVYKKTDDNFLLYTPGPSLVDHGGKMTKMWAEDGDTIFWPVEKVKPMKTTGRPSLGMPGMGQAK